MSKMNAEVPIAIIGMSCRFAGDVNNPEDLWELCAEGKSAWSEIPSSRFNMESFFHPNFEKTSTSNVRGGHFLKEDVGLFDAGFFNVSAETAAALDPQFRIQLESTYEAFENAGLSMKDVAGSNTSLFGGSFFRDYHDAIMRDPELIPRYLLVGVGSAMASNRISHYYDLRGASMSIDTGCSTTLTTFHQACQNLRSMESDMSVVGGANIILNPDNFIGMSSLRLISPSGRSYAFDSRASGYGRGEGSAVVVLKRLDDAIRDGDPIRAVIRGSGCNQDGKTDTITTPSQEAQEELMRLVYKTSGLDPAQTTYFEAHGTGTPTGDPIECRAIASVFQAGRPVDDPLLIGSVKTNVGHTETTSGLAAIVKVALALERGQIPPSVNFEKPNPNLHFDEWNMKVARKVETWDGVDGIRRASVNNFGYGGANAHVIMEDYSSYLNSTAKARAVGVANGDTTQIKPKLDSRVIMLSAKDEVAAKAMVVNLKNYLEKNTFEDEEAFLDDLAYTLGQRRSIFPWMSAVPAQSIKQLISTIDAGKMVPIKSGDAPRLGFVFTGAGAQWWAMGRELIDAYPVFRNSLLKSQTYFKELGAPWQLLDELRKDAKTTRVNELAMSSPLCAAIQCALVDLLRSWGINPAALTSHSSGEIPAAYAAGLINLPSALAIVYARGSLSGEAAAASINRQGGMLAVGLGAQEVEEKYLPRVTAGKVCVACLNSPSSVTASGDVPGIEQLDAMLQEDKVFSRRLMIDTAYHSHHMLDIAGPYRDWLLNYGLPSASLPEGLIYSSPTTGGIITRGEDVCAAEHWVSSLTNPVRFVESFTKMCLGESAEAKSPLDVDAIVEVGPHSALGGPIAELLAQEALGGIKVPYFSCLTRKVSALESMQLLASNLVRQGYPVNMEAVNFPNGRKHVKVLSDLPPYPWNHLTRHWAETRFNKSHRNRLVAPHDLLGSLAIGTNMLAPSWRLVVRPSDIPWVRDHVIQGNILYPGGAFICMAIEGACQLAETEGKRVLSYQLRDIDISAALVVPDTAEGIELQLTLRPCDDKANYAKGYYEFFISSVSGENKWTEHSRGLILTNVATIEDADTETSDVSPLEASRKLDDYRKRLDPRDLYDSLRTAGIYHGPIFQNLKSIKCRDNQSVSIIEIADVAGLMPQGHQHKHVIDPTTLDTIFQAAYTALPNAGSRMTTSLLPRTIKSLWISNKINSVPGHRFRAHTDINRASVQSFDTDVKLVDDGDDFTQPLLAIEGFTFQSIGNALSQETPFENDKFSFVKWLPDITTAKSSFLKEELSTPITQAVSEELVDLRRLSINFIQDALASITATDVRKLDGLNKKFYVWMKFQLGAATLNQLAADSQSWTSDTTKEKVDLIKKATAAGIDGEILSTFGLNLLPLLKGEVTPMEVLLQGSLLTRYYSESLRTRNSNEQIAKLVTHFIHKNPRAKILEIGAGTGSTTEHVLKALGSEELGNGPLAASYEFTDKLDGPFEAAKEQFESWTDLVSYKKLDIEQDPLDQGFTEGSYDLIIASNVLHATKNMENTLTNVHKLLKSGGSLFIGETTQNQVDLQVVFGLFSAWSSEQERPYGTTMSVDNWDSVLRKSGFEGVITETHDYESEDLYSSSVIVSKPIVDKIPQYPSEVVLVTGKTLPPTEWLTQVASEISLYTGVVPTVASLETVSCEDKIVIFVAEVDSTLLNDPTAAEFEAIKTLCTKSKGLLWLTRGGVIDYENPQAALHAGFLRCIRVEYMGKRLATFDFDPKKPLWNKGSIANLTEVFSKIFDYAEDDMEEFEYAERDNTLLIPRYYKDIERNKTVYPAFEDSSISSLKSFQDAGIPLRLISGTPGVLDTLAFTADVTPLDLPASFIEVEPKAFGVNIRDVMVALDQLDAGEIGSEFAGVVTRVSDAAAAKGFKKGDRVAGLLAEGNIGNLVRLHWTNAVHIPETMSFEIAATLPVAWATAYLAVVETARVKKGDTVLIHAASGGFGQAAIALAKLAGAEIFVTVGTPEKKNLIIEKFGIPADNIFSSRNNLFTAQIAFKTGGRGVDVVLNTLAGSLMQESFNCIAPFGRFVEVRKREKELGNNLQMASFAKSVSFTSIDMHAFASYKGDEINRILKEVVALLSDNTVSAIAPVTSFPLSDAISAFKLVQSGAQPGKVVLSVSTDDQVPVLPQTPRAKLASDASYLIVGGLGGIGRSVCYWMAEHGAKNLILLSRSASEEKARPFINDMEKIGVKVKLVGCDVSNLDQLKASLSACRSSMPPVRGVIQAAMVLRDSILEQMSVDDYMTGIKPKVQGSWNLHEVYNKKDQLDFFVILSSIMGTIGYASQCNYAAGGVFEDALARYRTIRGLPCASLDVGVVKSIGVVAENDGIEDRLRKSGHLILSEDNVMSAIESVIVSPPSLSLNLGLNPGPGAHWEESGMARDLRFRVLKHQEAASNASAGSGASDLGSQIAAAASLEEAIEIISEGLCQKVMEVFVISDVVPSQPLAFYGVDSLTAVEMRNMLALKAGAEVSIFDIMQGESIAALAATVAKKSKHINPSFIEA